MKVTPGTLLLLLRSMGLTLPGTFAPFEIMDQYRSLIVVSCLQFTSKTLSSFFIRPLWPTRYGFRPHTYRAYGNFAIFWHSQTQLTVTPFALDAKADQ